MGKEQPSTITDLYFKALFVENRKKRVTFTCTLHFFPCDKIVNLFLNSKCRQLK